MSTQQPEFTMQRLRAYSYAAVLFDESKDIISSFLPLIEYVIVNSEKNVITWNNLVSLIDKIYHTKIPSATLHNLLYLLKEKGVISFNKLSKEVNIIDKSKISAKQDNIDNYLQELLDQFCSFLQQKGQNINCDSARDIICSFVFNNADILSNLIKSEREITSKDFFHKMSDENLFELIEFILTIKEENSNPYKALLLLYAGATQACLLNLTTEEIKEAEKSELKVKKIILDTNFIMRLLDIQNLHECTMAKETLGYIQKLDAQLIVLPCSIKEVQGSIKSFLQQIAPYSAKTGEFLRHEKIRTTGILAAYNRGKTSTDLLAISNGIEALLTNMKIFIDKDDKYDEEFDDDFLQSLIDAKSYGYNYQYSRTQAKHDMHLIEYCRKNRTTLCNSIVNTECFILTNDLKLTQWNQSNCIDGGFHECVSEIQLANLFWLQRKTTSNEGIINVVVALANQYYTDTSQLLSFITKMDKYQKNKKSDGVTTTAIVHANNMITSYDIARVNAEELEIESLYNEKFKIAQKEKLEIQEAIANTKAQNKELQNSIASATTKTRELEEHVKQDEVEKQELRKSIDAINLEIQKSKQKNEKEKQNLIKFQADEKMLHSYKVAKLVYKNLVRIIAVSIWFCAFIIGAILMRFIPEALYKKVETYLSNDIAASIAFLVSCSTLIGIVLCIMTFILATFIAGECTQSPIHFLQIISGKITKKISKSIFGVTIQVVSLAQIEEKIEEFENKISAFNNSSSSESL